MDLYYHLSNIFLFLFLLSILILFLLPSSFSSSSPPLSPLPHLSPLPCPSPPLPPSCGYPTCGHCHMMTFCVLVTSMRTNFITSRSDGNVNCLSCMLFCFKLFGTN